AVASLLALLVLVFLGGFAGVVWKWQDEKAARADADQARQKADENAAEIGRQLELMNNANDLVGGGQSFKGGNGKWGEAEDRFNKAIAAKPDHKDLYVARGTLYAELGLLDRAATDFGRVLALQESQTTFHWYTCALLRVQAGDVAGYRQTCRRMLDHF